MKTKLLLRKVVSGRAGRLCLFAYLGLAAQQTFSQYTPVAVEGFNADVVCDAPVCSGTSTLDGDWYFYSEAKKEQGALPQTITSGMNVEYKLASFDGDNVLTVGSNGVKTGLLTLTTPMQAHEIWLLGMSAHNQNDIIVKINYTDNTSSDNIKMSFSDWHQSNKYRTAYGGLGRLKSNTSYENKYEFGLFERIIPTNPSKTIKSIRFEYPDSDKTSYTSIFAVSAYLGGERPQDKELYMVANAHFDTQWDWDVQTSIDQYVKNTLEGNFNLFEKFPAYLFNFEGAIKYMFAKEYYPELYEKLKAFVASGNWHISGGSIDANDVMVPSAESIIRNFLLGQEFYKKEFGVKGGNDIMLPDCFGFPYSLPTLGKHCGIKGFHSQKLSWGSAYSYDNLPHFGIWQGVDGSQIYAVHKAGAYVNQYKENMAYNADVLNEINANKEELGASKTFRYFGTGDRGGSVDVETVEWLEKSKAANGPVKVKVVTPDQFFETITPAERATLPVWNNELPMKEHGVGCYTSQTILKYWNRKGELLADATEKSSTLADYLGGLPYQSDIIRDSWVRLLWHQFHDDLTGTSIPRAYKFTSNDLVLNQLDLGRTLNNSVGAVSRKMDTQVSGTPVIIYNPLSIERQDIVEATISLASKPSTISVYNTSGEAVAAQITDYKDGVLSFIFKANAPSLGYSVYDLRLDDDASSKLTTSLSITESTIENDEYKITLSKVGDVMSILDKKQGSKELLKSPIRLSLQSDQPGYWWSWEISWGDNERAPFAYVDETPQVSIAEEGPLRSALKISRTKRGSQFVQYIRMTSGVNEDRIDFINEVDWQTKGTLLKAVFPLTVATEKATYDLSIGTIERGNRNSDMHEVAGHQWADMTHNDNSYGVSILNDSKYGWDKVDNNTLRLTLIHTPKVGGDREYQQYQDLGLNKFSYSFYRHMNNWDQNTQWQAAKLNQPLLAYEAPKHEGALGKSFEFVKLNTDKVAIKALKKAEASDNMIVRVYELVGDSHTVDMTFPSEIASAKEVNGLEEEVGNALFSGNKLTFTINKYQPKTFAVKLVDYVGEKVSEPSSAQVALEYNIDVMSPDSKKKDGRFGTSNYTYPAELFEDEIVADGIHFKVGPRENGAKNAVQCKGQAVDLPEASTNKKLYILAASQKAEGSVADFLIDGKDHSLRVEYFAGLIGTWGSVFADQHYRKENVAFTATHRHNYQQNKNDSYSYLSIYKYMIPIGSDTKKLTLPNDPDIIVFAVSVSDNENDDLTPVTEIFNLPEYKDITPKTEMETCGEKLTPTKFAASGYTNVEEKPEMAADNDTYSKWCDDSSNSIKTLQYGFDEPVRICQWNILHGALEGNGKITSDFKLQGYNSDTKEWYDVDVVTGNTQNKTVRTVEPFVTDRVRLYITKAEQSGNTARIYSFDLYGKKEAMGLETSVSGDKISIGNYPNPFRESTTIICNVPEYTNNIRVDVYSTTGALMATKVYDAADGRNEIVWNNNLGLSGMYFYVVSATNSGRMLQRGIGKMFIE